MLNRLILMGRLAADPELRTTPNGVSVASFRIGVTRDYNREQTDWINIVAWRQTAEFVSKYFFKGSMIALEGSLQSRQYQDRDGNNRRSAEVVADNVYFGDSKRDAESGGSYSAPPAYGSGYAQPSHEPSGFAEIDDQDGDLPF